MAKQKLTAKRILMCSGEAAQAISPSGTNDAGQPVRKFRKELIRTGKFTHPVTGQDFQIDGKWLDNAESQFKKMVAAGVKVPVMSGHSFSADDARGGALDIFREGDSLVGIMELVGEDGISAAGRNDVSIFAEPSFKDAHGNEYPWAIQHVALTPVPVIPGMSGFVSLAASRDGNKGKDDVPVFRLSTELNKMNENIARLAKAMGLSLAADATEEAATEQMLAHVAKQGETVQSITASRDSEKKRADEATLALSAAKPKEYDEPTLSLHRENREMKIDAVYKAGKITKDACQKLKDIWIGGDKSLALSATLDTANNQRFKETIDMLNAAPPIRTLDETQSLAQGIKLSSDRQDKEDADPDLELRLARAGVPVKK